MTFRTIEVQLRANTASFRAELGAGSQAVKQFGNDVTGAAASGNEALQTLGKGGVLAGAAVAGGFALATGATMEFDRAMSEVGAVANATAGEMGLLRDAAIDAGAATSFSASEAAVAQAELVKAGISVQDVLGGGLRGALDLAAAGSLDLADAATIAAQAMNLFDLGGQDVAHIADVLAAGANKSAADVGQLGDALRQGGLVASQTGLSLEETAGALAAFADNALVGSDAGTSLKTMLQRLTPQSEEAAALMEQLGFSAYDLQGNFIGLEGLAGELQDAMGAMTVEQRNMTMATLFGSDAVRAANVLYEEGAAGVRDYVTAVDDQGAAADMAAKKLDNLSGDMEALSGSLETFLISGGSKATGVLRGLAQGATDVVNGFGALPDSLQTITLGIGGLTGVVAMAGGGFLVLTPRIVQTKAQLDALAISAPRAAAGLSTLGAAAGLATAAIIPLTAAMTLYGNIQREGAEKFSAFEEGLPRPESLDDRRVRLEALTDEYERLGGFLSGEQGGIGGFLREFGQNFNPWDPNTISEAEVAHRALGAAINAENEEYTKLKPAITAAMEATGLTEAEVMKLAGSLGVDLAAAGFDGTAAIGSVIAEAKRIGEAVPESDRMTMSLEDQEAAAEALLERLTELGDSYGGFTDAMAAWDDVLARADEDARERAQERADEENAAIDERIEGVRRSADETAEAMQREADDHIRAAGLTGQAAEDVRRAAQDKATAVREGVDAEAAALEDAKVSWEDFVGEVKVSTADLIAEWEAQVEAQMEWKANLVEITVRGREDVAKILADMGPEGAQLAAQFADMTVEELERGGDLFVQAMSDGGHAAGLALEDELKIANRLAQARAQDTAQSIADELGVLPGAVAWIAGSMSIELGKALSDMVVGTEEYVRRIRTIYSDVGVVSIGGGVRVNRWGDVHEYATGGLATTPAHIAGPRTIHKYAEPETGGEAYIPRIGNSARSLGILQTAAGWYGAEVVPRVHSYASGGLADPGSAYRANAVPDAVMGRPGNGGGIDYGQLAKTLASELVASGVDGGSNFTINYPKAETVSEALPRWHRKAAAARGRG